MNPTPADSTFHSTRWTLVLRSRGDAPEARTALGELCEVYWAPVFRFLRSEGRTDDDSRELAQEFFARLLARGGFDGADPTKGRFRSYLLGALKHFLAERRRNEGREKRGGGAVVESLDAATHDTAPGLRIADTSAAMSDKHFDREWALAVMDRSLKAVQADFEKAGKSAHFEALKPWLAGDTDQLSQADAATQLGVTTGAVKVMIHRLRKTFRAAVEAEIAQTVPATEDIDEELRYLIEVLS
ncbi:MAG: sigma-70 family RNA polymerase sigma factor [Verrucomicrobiaceae bacterium]|nr:sigma-70 family RNA polymerase sigma factor [Verrucomicrobiaceae bacterium]